MKEKRGLQCGGGSGNELKEREGEGRRGEEEREGGEGRRGKEREGEGRREGTGIIRSR
jgi:hypothetical protein